MTITFTWIPDAYTEVVVEVEFTCSPYYPARVGGPPEMCDPAEGGEIETIDFAADPDHCTPAQLEAFRLEYHRGGTLAEAVDTACFEEAVSGQGSDDYDRAEWFID